MESILTTIGEWIKTQISHGGYFGVVILMALESACIPLPSEVIMPFAGALTVAAIAAPSSPMNLHVAALAGALGCAIGSAVAYLVGATGGREVVLRFGRYILLNPRDVAVAESWFARSGSTAVFVSRLLPVVRTFISLPAGIARMPFGRFLVLSFLGSVPWCYLLVIVGRQLGKHIDVLKHYFHAADGLIGALIVVGAVLWVRHHLARHEDPEPVSVTDGK